MDKSVKLDVLLGVEEVPAEPDEVKAIQEARADRESNGTVSHDAIDWD